MFKLVGRLEGKTSELIWDNGEVTGTPRAVEIYNLMQKEYDQSVYVPTLGSIDNPDSSEPLACYILMNRILFPVKKTSGDIPQLPSIPDGAIA